jgi:hypothetical protein
MRTSQFLTAICTELFAHVRVMALVFFWAICMVSPHIWLMWSVMPEPKPDIHISLADVGKTFLETLETSQEIKIPPPALSPAHHVLLPSADRLVENGPLPVSGLPSASPIPVHGALVDNAPKLTR